MHVNATNACSWCNCVWFIGAVFQIKTCLGLNYIHFCLRPPIPLTLHSYRNTTHYASKIRCKCHLMLTLKHTKSFVNGHSFLTLLIGLFQNFSPKKATKKSKTKHKALTLNWFWWRCSMVVLEDICCCWCHSSLRKVDGMGCLSSGCGPCWTLLRMNPSSSSSSNSFRDRNITQ